jgi:D-alanine-D-alanine ligase
MMEIASTIETENFVYSVEVKRDWHRRVVYHIPPRLDHKTLTSIKNYALTAYRLLGCRDIARMDFRLDSKGVPHFIECNPLPGLDPGNSDVVIPARDAVPEPVPYEKLVQGILLDAMRRVGSV